MKSVFKILAACLCVLAGPIWAQTPPPALYDANAANPPPNPDSAEGGDWRQFEDPAQETRNDGEVIGGKNWGFLLLTPTDAKSMRSYEKALDQSVLSDPRGWTATAILRVPAARAQSLLGAYVRVLDGSHDYLMSFINDKENRGISYRSEGVELSDALSNLRPAEIGEEYVTAQMFFDPVANETKFYVNGKLLAALPLENTAATRVDTPRIRWGKSSAWPSTVHWNKVSFEAGNKVLTQ